MKRRMGVSFHLVESIMRHGSAAAIATNVPADFRIVSVLGSRDAVIWLEVESEEWQTTEPFVGEFRIK